VDDQDVADRLGAIEAKVRGDVDALVSTHPMGESLAEMAFKLARTLDSGGVKDLAVAGINKELRETLCELARLAEGDDDDLAAALSVPTSLRNGAES
jgi:hypothetical protein